MRLKQCFWFGALLAFCVASAGQASGASIGKADDIASGASGNTVFFGRYPQTDQGREGADPAPSGTEYVDWITDSYVNSHEAAVTRYYTIDPIEWRVLSKADGKIFLLSEKILDAKPYHTSNVPVTWEESTVRAWLNGYEAGEDADSFLDRAFASNEAGAIAQTPLVNADNPTFSTPGGNDTTDRIFFLSIAEAKKTEYGFESAGDDDDSRKSRNTGYAERIINGIPDAGDPDFWWLRSPGDNDAHLAAIVGDVGYVDDSGSTVDYPGVGVRPAFNLNLSSVIFTSAAAGGKPALTDPPSLDSVIAPASGPLKLTLKDPSLTLTVTASEAQKTQSVSLPGGILEFSYEGTRPRANNQYVSCILEDGGGAITHYGKLKWVDSQAASSGTLSVPLPALTDGTYTLSIFSEQANGDKYTDFAGNPATMTLTVSGGGQTASVGQASGAGIGKADDIASGNTVFFGRYPQTDAGINAPSSGVENVDWISASYGNSDYDSSKAGTRYYTIDPIGWRVLSNADGKVFLLSEKILDAKPYHTSSVPVTWEESTVRAWLNGYAAGETGASAANPEPYSFLDRAFAPKEAGAIAGTPVVNADNPTFSTPGGNDTTDRIFFLSIAEAKKTEYGFESTDDDDSRKSLNTGYAERIKGMSAAGDPDFWWLRSPGYDGSGAAFVGDGGWVSVSGNGSYVGDPAVGLRPAFNLNLSSVIFTSAAAGGKSVPTIPSLTDNPSPGPGDDLKLTVKDPSQTLTVTASEAQKTQSVSLPGGSLEFSYEGARTGANQYVSCILEDGGGDITHYGKLADSSAVSSGTLSVPLPALTDGTYILSIFSEQANGDKYTDFAGDPATMTLTVSGGGQTASVSNFSGELPQDGGGGGYLVGFASLAGLALAFAALARKRR